MFFSYYALLEYYIMCIVRIMISLPRFFFIYQCNCFIFIIHCIYKLFGLTLWICRKFCLKFRSLNLISLQKYNIYPIWHSLKQIATNFLQRKNNIFLYADNLFLKVSDRPDMIFHCYIPKTKDISIFYIFTFFYTLYIIT